MTLRFSVGEIAIHVGRNQIQAGAECEIVAVGPWGPRESPMHPHLHCRCRCDDACDYLVRDAEGYFFTRDFCLRRPPSSTDYTDTDHYAQIFKTDLIQGEVKERA